MATGDNWGRNVPGDVKEKFPRHVGGARQRTGPLSTRHFDFRHNKRKAPSREKDKKFMTECTKDFRHEEAVKEYMASQRGYPYHEYVPGEAFSEDMVKDMEEKVNIADDFIKTINVLESMLYQPKDKEQLSLHIREELGMLRTYVYDEIQKVRKDIVYALKNKDNEICQTEHMPKLVQNIMQADLERNRAKMINFPQVRHIYQSAVASPQICNPDDLADKRLICEVMDKFMNVSIILQKKLTEDPHVVKESLLDALNDVFKKSRGILRKQRGPKRSSYLQGGHFRRLASDIDMILDRESMSRTHSSFSDVTRKMYHYSVVGALPELRADNHALKGVYCETRALLDDKLGRNANLEIIQTELQALIDTYGRTATKTAFRQRTYKSDDEKGRGRQQNVTEKWLIFNLTQMLKLFGSEVESSEDQRSGNLNRYALYYPPGKMYRRNAEIMKETYNNQNEFEFFKFKVYYKGADGSLCSKIVAPMMLFAHSPFLRDKLNDGYIALPQVLDGSSVEVVLNYMHGHEVPMPPLEEMVKFYTVCAYFRVYDLTTAMTQMLPEGQRRITRQYQEYAVSLSAPRTPTGQPPVSVDDLPKERELQQF